MLRSPRDLAGEGYGDNSGEDPGAAAEAQARKDLEGKSVEEIIREGHKSLLVGLVAKSNAGTITAAEASTLRAMLKDNGMTLGVPPSDDELPREAPTDLSDIQLPDGPDYA